MEHLLLGLVIGLVAVAPPGPVALGLMQLGTHRGRRPALAGAVGIACGDLFSVGVAIALVGAGAMLPNLFFGVVQVVAALLFLAIGGLVLTRPAACGEAVAGVKRPGRSFFLVTSLTPTVLGAWLALLLAMPFSGDLALLLPFGVGAVLASFVWHPALAVVAGRLGRTFTAQGQRRLSQLGGVCTMGLGAIAMASIASSGLS